VRHNRSDTAGEFVQGVKWQALWTSQSLGLYYRLMTAVTDPALRREYRRRFWNFVRHRLDPAMWLFYLIKTSFH
jgi:hypothetical protein